MNKLKSQHKSSVLSRRAQLICLWAKGFIAATLFIWLSTASFLNTTPVWEYDIEIGQYVMANEHVQLGRSEGWGTTVYGKHDISAIPDVDSVHGPKLAVYGDSFVEGHHLQDSEKLAQQITYLWRRTKGTNLTAVAIAKSGRSISDHLLLIHAYESILHPVAHYIIITDITDLCPDGSGFIQNGTQFSLKPKDQYFSGLQIRRFIALLHLEFLYKTAQRFINALDQPNALRFGLGRVSVQTRQITADSQFLEPPPLDAWRFIIRELKKTTNLPIGFVYSPGIPTIHEGQVNAKDKYAAWAAELNVLCKNEGVAFIDVTKDNVELFKRDHIFPRGFNNGKPDKGHCNARGLRIIAEALIDSIED